MRRRIASRVSIALTLLVLVIVYLGFRQSDSTDIRTAQPKSKPAATDLQELNLQGDSRTSDEGMNSPRTGEVGNPNAHRQADANQARYHVYGTIIGPRPEEHLLGRIEITVRTGRGLAIASAIATHDGRFEARLEPEDSTPSETSQDIGRIDRPPWTLCVSVAYKNYDTISLQQSLSEWNPLPGYDGKSPQDVNVGNILLAPAGTIYGRVIAPRFDHSGPIKAHAFLVVEGNPTPLPVKSAVCDSGGQYQLQVVQPGQYLILIDSEDMAPASQRTSIELGSAVQVADITLKNGEHLGGCVPVSPQDQLWSKAYVECEAVFDGLEANPTPLWVGSKLFMLIKKDEVVKARTQQPLDSTGAFLLEGLASLAYSLRVCANPSLVSFSVGRSAPTVARYTATRDGIVLTPTGCLIELKYRSDSEEQRSEVASQLSLKLLNVSNGQVVGPISLSSYGTILGDIDCGVIYEVQISRGDVIAATTKIQSMPGNKIELEMQIP